MSMSEFKNESLFRTSQRISEEDARITVMIALRRGWAHLPDPNAAKLAKPPHAKKRMWLSCEDFRTDGPKAKARPQPMQCIPVNYVPSDVPAPA